MSFKSKFIYDAHQKNRIHFILIIDSNLLKLVWFKLLLIYY